jgi:hypothetical protein
LVGSAGISKVRRHNLLFLPIFQIRHKTWFMNRYAHKPSIARFAGFDAFGTDAVFLTTSRLLCAGWLLMGRVTFPSDFGTSPRFLFFRGSSNALGERFRPS